LLDPQRGNNDTRMRDVKKIVYNDCAG